jgi:hypothetical protein
VLEVGLFTLGFILFLSAPRLMGFIWLHIFHLPRGWVGFLLIKRLPRSHDVVEKIVIPETADGSHYSIEAIRGVLKGSISQIFLNYSKNCKRLFLAYGALTSLSLIFDFVEFLIQYIRFGYRGDEHSDLAMLGITLLFLALDFFYIAWAFQAKGKFPDTVF